jgi:hypothetical protein
VRQREREAERKTRERKKRERKREIKGRKRERDPTRVRNIESDDIERVVFQLDHAALAVVLLPNSVRDADRLNGVCHKERNSQRYKEAERQRDRETDRQTYCKTCSTQFTTDKAANTTRFFFCFQAQVCTSCPPRAKQTLPEYPFFSSEQVQ